MNLVVDGWTNRVAGQGYDAAGNMTHAPESPSQTLGWDAESRMTVAWGVGGIWNYTYGAGNKRVEALGPADGSRRVYFYDVTGELLGEYSVLVDGQGKLYPKQERMRVSFAGRPLAWEDRLGSKVAGPIDQQTGQAARYRYYPYGQNIGANVGWDDAQFAAYTRDRATGLDYARNRYYTRTWGRFLSPDPCVASGGPADPGSWNRYAYVQGDPVNYGDPEGLARCSFGGLHHGVARFHCEGRFGTSTHDFATMSLPFHISSMDSTTIGVFEQMAATSVGNYVDRVSEKEWAGKGVLAALSELTGRCQGLFNTQAIRASASRLKFWDGRLHKDGLLRVNDVLAGTGFSMVAAGANHRLHDIYFGVAQAYVVTDGLLRITNQVVLRANFFSLPWKVTGTPGPDDESWGQNITLVHELLHYHHGRDDADLADFLGIPARFGPMVDRLGASSAISRWLQAGCPKE